MTYTIPFPHELHAGNARRRTRTAPREVFAWIDVPNLEINQGTLLQLNFAAVRGVICRRGEYLAGANLYLSAPRKYSDENIRSLPFDLYLTTSLGFDTFYAFNGYDVDPIMRDSLAKAEFLDELIPGDECVILLGSGDGGYISSLRSLMRKAQSRDIKLLIRVFAHGAQINGALRALAHEVIDITNLRIFF